MATIPILMNIILKDFIYIMRRCFFSLLFQLIGKIPAYYATIIGSNPGLGMLQ